MAEMMAIDKQGGAGLAGTINVSQLTYDKHERRGLRAPVLGWDPFQVSGFCSTEELERMLGAKPAWADIKPVNQTPLRGHGLTQPGTLFGQSADQALTLALPPVGTASKL